MASGGEGGVDVLRLVVKPVPLGSDGIPDPDGPNCVVGLVCEARVFTKNTVETDTLGVTGGEEVLSVFFKTGGAECVEFDSCGKLVAGDSIGMLGNMVTIEIETLGAMVMVETETVGVIISVETKTLGGILGTEVGRPVSALEEGRLDGEEAAGTPGDCVLVGGLELVGSSSMGTVD